MEVQIKDNKIFAPLKDKWLVLKPEEEVRQNYICRLVNNYDYCIEQMTQELQVTNSQRGQGAARADIVVWKSEKDKAERKSPIIIVECKAENVTIHQEDYFQGYNYAAWAGADFFVTTNQKETRIFKVVKGEIPQKLVEIADIPNAKTATNDKAIEKLLAQTKSFTRDEFSKLLFKCHNIIRNNDKLSPEAAFDEISKILFIKVRFERDNTGAQIFSLEEFKNAKATYEKYKPKDGPEFYQFLFSQTKDAFKDDHLFEDNEIIKIRENSFEQIVKELQIYNLSTTSDDVKGIAFEKFLGRTFRGELGQFFTPRTIVNFMVDVVNPREGEFVCDPCCGSGGFLIKAFEHVREQIETDIQKQKEILKQSFFTDQYDDASDEEKEKIEKQVDEAFNKLNEELNISNSKGRLRSLSFDCIYGTDANPRMARTAKMNMIMHGDGHGGVHHHDGLLNVNGIFENRFDVILTNPPFGSRVEKDSLVSEEDRFTDQEKIKKYTQRYGEAYVDALKQVNDHIGKPLLQLYQTGSMSGLTEVLFIERCLKLLKPGGRMAIVLPEGVLNNTNLQKIRKFVEQRAKILLIVSIPQDVFIASGATVKPSLLFFKKFTDEEQAEFDAVTLKATTEVNDKYNEEMYALQTITDKSSRGLSKAEKDALSKEKKEAKARIKEIETAKETEIWALVKERFDYEIPIAEVAKAGIDTTGKEIDNELIPLAEEFAKYRADHKLWIAKSRTAQYNLKEGELMRTIVDNDIASEPEMFY